MNCLIKEWPNKAATLMTEDGVVLWTFSSIEEASEVWRDWCMQQNPPRTSTTESSSESITPA